MLLKEVEYVRPQSLSEAMELLATIPDAGILAGGQSLINVLKMRIGGYGTLIDISALDELKTIDETDETLSIGAAVTYSMLTRSVPVTVHRPALAEVAARIADQQVRNRGTIGGNCCYNDPTCHFPPLLSALGATFVVGSQDGLKSIAASDFFVSYYQTALSPGEMLVAIRVPKLQPRQGDSFVPLSVGGTDVFNVVTVAGTVRFAEDGTISDCALVATGVAERPQHLAEVTARLVGTTGSEEAVNQAVAACDLGLFDPPSDVHASSEYRRAMVPVLARRAAAMAIIRARGDRQ